MMKAIYSTRAMIEMDAIADRIQQDSPRAALRFLEAVEQTADNLRAFPEIGAPFETDDADLSGLRVYLVSGFEKYLLFYRIRKDGINIERVVYGARDLPSILKEGS